MKHGPPKMTPRNKSVRWWNSVVLKRRLPAIHPRSASEMFKTAILCDNSCVHYMLFRWQTFKSNCPFLKWPSINKSSHMLCHTFLSLSPTLSSQLHPFAHKSVHFSLSPFQFSGRSSPFLSDSSHHLLNRPSNDCFPFSSFLVLYFAQLNF